MSRAPQYPTNVARTRSPQPPYSNGNGQPADGYREPIRPLQIGGRPPRPTTPTNSSMIAGSTGNGPSRPQRSDRRMRQASEYSASDAGSSRDLDYGHDRGQGYGNPGMEGYASGQPRSRQQNGDYSGASTPRPSYPRSRSGTDDTRRVDDDEVSPVSPVSPQLSAAISAFQTEGDRKRRNHAHANRERDRQREYEAEQLRQKKIRDKAPGRRVRGKAKAGDVDAVLDQIKDEWEFVVDDEFNPVDLALQLLDDTTAGKDVDSFRRTKDLLFAALKGSVDAHYVSFAQALPHHGALLNHLDMAQTQVKEARTALQESKEALGNKRADLVQIWTRGQTIEEMIRILDQIEHLKTVPDALETLMSEKRLLHASVLLVRSLKTISRPDMLEIGALADLRSYLTTQETALREILVDELHSHLYLKSFWCESRWAPYTPGQQTMPKLESDDDPAADSPISPSSSTRRTRLTRYLNDLTLRSNDPPYDLNEPNLSRDGRPTSVGGTSTTPGTSALATLSVSFPSGANLQQTPEGDSFAYIEMILESLAVLGKLGSALDNVAQRLPNEIYSLVETTLDEVADRAEFGRRLSFMATGGPTGISEGVYFFSSGISSQSPDDGALASVNSAAFFGRAKDGFWKASTLRLAALESSTKHVDHETLKDLFWTMYSKLDAVTQGLRVVYEVANRIGSRRDFKDASGARPGSLFPLAEIWLPVNGEVRTLLNDYITDDEQGTVSGRNPISSINETLREGRYARDKMKAVFRFADTDMKSTNKLLKAHEEELIRVLRDTVPGLVHGTSDTTTQATLSAVGSDERMLGVGQHHRLLIKPDAFHVGVLFQPTLAFLERVAEILPSGVESARAATAVLDDFVLEIYLPQLEEKVGALFHQAVSGPEAFQTDSASLRLSPEPLVKASTQLMALINSLCVMLRTTPFHRENYARLILGVIIQFYQRCSDRFQYLVAVKTSEAESAQPAVALAAQWAQRTDLGACLTRLLTSEESDTSARQELCRDETRLELEFLGAGSVGKDDLVASTRNLAELCSLYRSVAWFASELALLREESQNATSPLTPRADNMLVTTPYTPNIPALPPTLPGEQLKLPLGRDMLLRFQALLKTYDLLAELILWTIRVDVRCRTMHYLELTTKHGNYRIDHEVSEPDPPIIDLNAALGKCDDAVNASLPKREQRFVFEGLGQLMENLLVAGGRHIRFANDFGMKKMLRNTLALQQSLKTLSSDASPATDFERAKRYYTLFFQSPTDMLSGIRQKQMFDFEEYKAMLNLQCGVDQALGDKGAQQGSDRNYSMYFIDLHGLEMENTPM